MAPIVTENTFTCDRCGATASGQQPKGSNRLTRVHGEPTTTDSLYLCPDCSKDFTTFLSNR